MFRYTPLPDSILARATDATGASTSVDAREQKYGGINTPFGAETPGFHTPAGDIDMKKIGQARNTLMDIKLTQVFEKYWCILRLI